MKRLDIDPELEKALIQVFDLALKHAGFQAQQLVQHIVSKVYEVPKEG